MTGTTMTESTAARIADPRPAYAAATAWMTELLANVTDEQSALPTPCAEFDVSGLVRHIVGTGRRAEAAGAGADVLAVAVDSPDFVAADYAPVVARAIDHWRDDATLTTTIRVPWGEVPGIGVLWGYVNETLVHAWDLAVATGQPTHADSPSADSPSADASAVDPGAAEGALAFARQFIPAEIRDDPHVPFGPVVEPREGADAIERLANWSGRISLPWMTRGATE